MYKLTWIRKPVLLDGVPDSKIKKCKDCYYSQDSKCINEEIKHPRSCFCQLWKPMLTIHKFKYASRFLISKNIHPFYSRIK